MKNFIQTGDVLELTAPAGGVTSGSAYLIGGILVVAQDSADPGEKFVGKRAGVFTLPLNTGDTPGEGALAYWSNGDSEFTTTNTGNTLRGVFLSYNAAANTAEVLLTGQVI